MTPGESDDRAPSLSSGAALSSPGGRSARDHVRVAPRAASERLLEPVLRWLLRWAIRADIRRLTDLLHVDPQAGSS